VSVDTRPPRDASRYDSFEQDGVRVYYSPRLARKSELIELDYVRVLFRGKAVMSGPEELCAQVMMGRV
jgi:hypothetical protein